MGIEKQDDKDLKKPSCGLCFAAFDPNEEVAQIQCKHKHLFKVSQLKEWVNQDKKLSCPTCSENVFTNN